MKFARYLQDTQVPEWQKAYMDYRGLKVQLGVVRTQATQSNDKSASVVPAEADPTTDPTFGKFDDSKEDYLNRGGTTSARVAGLSTYGAGTSTGGTPNPSDRDPTSHVVRRRSSKQEKSSLGVTLATTLPHVIGNSVTLPSQQMPPPHPRTPRSLPVFPLFWDSAETSTPPPLRAILADLPSTHTRFFNMLNDELEKVESFYAEREKEMNERAKQIKDQLDELGIHHEMSHAHQPSAHSMIQHWTKRAHFSVLSAFLTLLMQWFPDKHATPEDSDQSSGGNTLASESGRNGHRDIVVTSDLRTHASEHRRWSGDGSTPSGQESPTKSGGESNPVAAPLPDALGSGSPHERPDNRVQLTLDGPKHPLNHHGYRHAKKRLRKAVVEHYRGLEVLSNYRILNLIGFRKALKKYEKITKNSVLDAYMNEKVEPSAFASGAIVGTMLKDVEDLFSAWFERGDRKRALDRLRVGPSLKTHHFSTFRSGFWLGLALPAIVGGTFLSFQENTHRSLPSWNILLMIYSIFLLPVLMVLLIGVNVAVWARERINYVFIFELNPKSRLDHHEYFELPALLFCTLAYAFWFSFAQIGPPLLWPLIWLALTLAIMLNPIRSCTWGPARWWTIKNIAKLGTSGIWKVEFTDFWLGDQLCSLVYSLSGTYFVGCFYTRFFSRFPPSGAPTLTSSGRSLYTLFPGNVTTWSQPESFAVKSVYQNLSSLTTEQYAQEAWSSCGTAANWGWYYLLAALPFAIRFIQSMRRYRDSSLHTHLINAGKYGMGMIYYFFYYYWRHRGMPHSGVSFIIWCFTGIIYGLYACAWDFLMDWSLCRPHARYPLLRSELVYKSQIPSYYFALVSNLCIRFFWVIYIPIPAPNITISTFILATLEMLRRVQWNLYRLENEHLGNVDQYRVTREVPLPYSVDTHFNEEEHEEEVVTGTPSWFKRWTVGLMRNQEHDEVS